MKTLNLQQGTPEWHETRLSHFTASEAPAMMGDSKYMTRDQLLNLKKTGVTEEVSAATQKIFDKGHQSEADFRPHAEEIVGEDLFPVTGSLLIDGLPLLASFDGLTMLEDVAFEHKLLNAKLKQQIEGNVIDMHYIWQLEQQLLVSGANKVLFVTSDGTTENMSHAFYVSSPELRAELIAGWKQFQKDLESYEPQEIKEAVVAEVIRDLPSVTVQVKGELTLSNLDEVTPMFDKFIDKAVTEFETDQDFADAEAQSKAARITAKACKQTARSVIDQMLSVSDAVKTLEEYAAKFDKLGLQQEKAVKAEKENIKNKLALTAKEAYIDHVAELDEEIAPIKLNLVTPNFALEMKGKRTVSSLKDAVDTALAKAKIEADMLASQFRKNLTFIREEASDYKFLFNDLQQIINNEYEAFTAIITNRINEHKEAEEKRLEKQREAIRIEEEAKAQKIIDDEAVRVEQERIAADKTPEKTEAVEPVNIEQAVEEKASITPEKVKDIKRRTTVATIRKKVSVHDIANYMTDEGFPQEHVEAILSIVYRFNESEQSEKEVFAFAAHLNSKYGAVA